MSAWIGLMAPTGTPQGVIDLIYKELAISLKEPNIQKKMSDMGVVPGGNTPAEFAVYLSKERETYKELAIKTGLKID